MTCGGGTIKEGATAGNAGTVKEGAKRGRALRQGRVGALWVASLLLSGVWMWPRTTVEPEGEDVRCGSAGAAWVPCVGPRMPSYLSRVSMRSGTTRLGLSQMVSFCTPSRRLPDEPSLDVRVKAPLGERVTTSLGMGRWAGWSTASSSEGRS